MMKEIRSLWALLGVVVAASSIASLIQRSFDIPLVIGLSDFLKYYRSLLEPIFSLIYTPIQQLFGISVPSWLQDVHTLSFIGASLQVKTYQIVSNREFSREPEDPKPTPFVTVFVGGILFLGIMFLPIAIYAMLNGLRYAVNQILMVGKITNPLHLPGAEKVASWFVLAMLGWIAIFVVIMFFLFNTILLNSQYINTLYSEL